MSDTVLDPSSPPTRRASVPFERRGVDRIPEEERTATPWTFFRINVGVAVALGSMAFGWLPLTFGLGLASAAASIVAGSVIGIAVILPLILIGSRTATNNATSSGAYFGVRGRLVGSALGWAASLANAAAVIWAGGTAATSAATRLFNVPASGGLNAAAYLLVTVLAVGVAIWGIHLLASANVVIAVSGATILLLMLVAQWDRIDLSYAGSGEYMLGGFWPTWWAAVLVVGVGGVLMCAPLLGDYTRYISPQRHSQRRLGTIGYGTLMVGYSVIPLIATVTATSFPSPLDPLPENLAAYAPSWYVALLLPMATLGTVGYAAASVYSGGLDVAAVFPRLKRVRATGIMAALALLLVLLGSLVWNAEDALVAALAVLLAVLAPWVAVVSIGFLRNRDFDLDDLQVANRGLKGGRYWYSSGWNWRAVIPWALGSVFGLLTVPYVGPWSDVAGGIDISFLGSLAIAGVSYLLLERRSAR